jgi:hypothetical protein
MEMPRGSDMTSYRKFDATKRVTIDEDLTQKFGETTYVVSGCMSFYVGKRDREYWVHVPHGHRLSGADIPRLFRGWIKPNSPIGKAAVIHHYLCAVGKVRINKVRLMVSRYEANLVFLQAMKVAGVFLLKRWFLFLVASLSDGDYVDREEAKDAFFQ